jgi:hypothetical protein
VKSVVFPRCDVSTSKYGSSSVAAGATEMSHEESLCIAGRLNA